MRIIMMFFFLFVSNFASSQVGINTAEPNTNTLLHVSEDPNNLKGIIIPRLTESERNKLTYSDDSSLRLDEKDNGLTIYNTDENCFNYWSTNKNKWEKLCGSLGKASFSFNCNEDVVLHGNYIVGEKVSTDEYVTINIDNVTTVGDYYIYITSDNDNGYSFVGSGTFTHKGSHVVKLYAQGTPKNATENDPFTISTSDPNTQNSCTLNVNVQKGRASYVINSQSTVVNGEYYKGTQLDSTMNTITLSINVYNAGSYSINTNTINGISFSKSGIFTEEEVGTTQPITLEGNGAPTTNNDFDVVITSNTTDGNATSRATIPITLPEMNVAIIGKSPSDYSWNSEYRQYGFDPEKQAFSRKGKFKIKKINILWSATDSISAVDKLSLEKKPDVILYYSYQTPPNEYLAKRLSDYTKRGGVLIFGINNYSNENKDDVFNSDIQQANLILQNIYSTPPRAYGKKTISYINNYQINNLPDDPIINGPFGNLSSQFFGEDNNGSIYVDNIPSSAIQIASQHNNVSNPRIDPNSSILWYDSSHNFVYIGNCTLASDDTTTSTIHAESKEGWPTLYNKATGLPTVKLAYGYWFNSNSTGQNPVYNSALEYNILAWALKKAAETGINQH